MNLLEYCLWIRNWILLGGTSEILYYNKIIYDKNFILDFSIYFVIVFIMLSLSIRTLSPYVITSYIKIQMPWIIKFYICFY